jgi:hypothetical protein
MALEMPGRFPSIANGARTTGDSLRADRMSGVPSSAEQESAGAIRLGYAASPYPTEGF